MKSLIKEVKISNQSYNSDFLFTDLSHIILNSISRNSRYYRAQYTGEDSATKNLQRTAMLVIGLNVRALN